MKEKQIEQKLRLAVKKAGGIAPKFTNSSRRGTRLSRVFRPSIPPTTLFPSLSLSLISFVPILPWTD